MIEYRRAVSRDLDALAVIEKGAGFSQWSHTQLADSVAQHIVWIIEVNDVICGFAVFTQVLDEAELLNIVVAKSRQGEGLGKRLLVYALGQLHGARHCFLEVAASNKPALALYKRLGFKQSAIRKNYYQTENGKENACIMFAELTELVSD